MDDDVKLTQFLDRVAEPEQPLPQAIWRSQSWIVFGSEATCCLKHLLDQWDEPTYWAGVRITRDGSSGKVRWYLQRVRRDAVGYLLRGCTSAAPAGKILTALSAVEESVLAEADSPFTRRCRWLITQGDPMTGFLTIDLVVRPRYAFRDVGYYAGRMRAGGTELAARLLREDFEELGLLAADAPDSTFRQLVVQYVMERLDCGKWYGDEDFPETTGFERMLGWLRGRIAADDVKALDGSAVTSIRDWASATRHDLTGMTVGQALHRSRRWHAEMVRVETEREMQAVPVTAEIEPGLTVHELGPEHLRAEGEAMRHCVGKSPVYADAVRKGNGKILSVRRDGRRLYTVELTKVNAAPNARSGYRPGSYWSLSQIQGFANSTPGSGRKDDDTPETASKVTKWMNQYVKELSAQARTGQPRRHA